MLGRFSLVRGLSNGRKANNSRFSFSNVHKSISCAPKRNMVNVMGLSYDTGAGLAPMLSKKSLDIVYRQSYVSAVKKVNDYIYATEFEECTLPEIIAKTMNRTDHYTLLTYAGFVSNSNHFLKPLTPYGTQCPEQLERMICSAFGSMEGLKEAFTNFARAAFGSPWVWLTLSEKGALDMVVSYNGDPIEVLIDDHPVLCLSMWEHVYVPDYGKDVEAYVNGWWESINWIGVAHNIAESRAYSNMNQAIVYGNTNLFPEAVAGAMEDSVARLNLAKEQLGEGEEPRGEGEGEEEEEEEESAKQSAWDMLLKQEDKK